jgi:hypothetical protein
MKMKLQEFEDTFQNDEFTVGDSFWLRDWEFQVVNARGPSRVVSGDEVVFRWELTWQEFVHVTADNHPEIEDTDGFFSEHQDEIIHRFQKGFDALVGGCGATYETVMSDAIDEAVAEWRDTRRAEGGKGQGATSATGAGEKGCEASFACSKRCKEVDEKMDGETQQRMEDYLALFAAISDKIDNDPVAIAIMQEVSKDRRSQLMQGERSEKDNRPATAKQKDYLRKLGIKFPENLSKAEASALIDEGLAKNGE